MPLFEFHEKFMFASGRMKILGYKWDINDKNKNIFIKNNYYIY